MERLNNAATRAINALPAEEADAFDALTAEDEHLRSYLDQFWQVADELVEGLPNVSPAPSPVIWERIAQEVGFEENSMQPADDSVTGFRPSLAR